MADAPETALGRWARKLGFAADRPSVGMALGRRWALSVFYMAATVPGGLITVLPCEEIETRQARAYRRAKVQTKDYYWDWMGRWLNGDICHANS
jgi:hypothetical protein